MTSGNLNGASLVTKQGPKSSSKNSLEPQASACYSLRDEQITTGKTGSTLRVLFIHKNQLVPRLQPYPVFLVVTFRELFWAKGQKASRHFLKM